MSLPGGPGRYFIINGNYLMTFQNSRDCFNFTTSRTFCIQTFLLVLKTRSIVHTEINWIKSDQDDGQESKRDQA